MVIGCSSPDIEFPDERELVVVDGWITDQLKQHAVKVSRTVGFQESIPEEPIEDATVFVVDIFLDSIPLAHTGNGVYVSPEFAGTVGISYRLVLELADGTAIRSSYQRINEVPEIQFLNYTSFVRQDPDTGEDVDVYYPIVFTQDPLDEDNYYWYKGFRNDVYLDEPENLELLSDQFIDGQFLAHNISEFEYDLGDEITIELYSINRESFNFLELLKNQTTSLGSSSGTAPATVEGNLTSADGTPVLGYFGASSVSVDSVMVQ